MSKPELGLSKSVGSPIHGLKGRATWLFTSRLCSASTEITPEKRYANLELRASGATFCKVRGLGERSDGKLRIFKDFKKIEDADKFEGLDCKFCGVEKLQGATTLFGRCKETHQKADATRVNGGDFLKIENEAGVACVNKISQCRSEPVERFAKVEAAAEIDELHVRLGADFDFQKSTSNKCAKAEKGRSCLPKRTGVC